MFRTRRIMPYDRVITVFTPDGRLLQVEYAMEVVKRGSTIMGLTSSEGVILAAEVRIFSKLQNQNFVWKIFKIDEHVGAAVSGLSSDAQILVERARLYSQSNRLIYDEAVDIKVLSETIANIQQLYTQRSWIRPFGVSIIFGGVDKTGPKVFKTDPSGAYQGHKAISTGAGSDTVMKVLEEEYRTNITLEKGITLAIICLSKTIDEKLEPEMIRIAVIPIKTKKLRKLTNVEISQYIK